MGSGDRRIGGKDTRESDLSDFDDDGVILNLIDF